MTKSRSILAIVLAAAGMAQAHTAEWPLRANGIGPLRIGMSFANANKAVHGSLTPTPVNLRGSPACDYLPLTGHPGVYVMFINDTLRRVDVTEPASRTEDGIAVGDTAQSVRDRYPDLTSAPQAYVDNEFTLTHVVAHGALAFRFDTQEGKIKTIFAGAPAHVAYIEGCL